MARKYITSAPPLTLPPTTTVVTYFVFRYFYGTSLFLSLSLSLSISLSPGLLYSRVRSLFFVLAEMRCLVGGTRRPILTASNPVRPFSDPRQNKKPATSKTVSINNNIAFSFRIIFIRVYLEKILVSVWTNTSQDPWLWRLDQIFSNILIIL